MKARWLRVWRSDDSGASLVFALIFITVISVVVAAVLALADASMRSIIRLRSVAAESAAVEGAANVAINALRKSTYTGSGGCFGGTSEVSVPSTQLPGPETVSARVTCTPESGMAVFPLGAPAQAILANSSELLPGVPDVFPGITFTDNNGAATPNGLRVSGNVYSNSSLLVGAQAQVVVDGGGVVRARRGCVRPPGVITTFPFVTPPGTITPNPTSSQCNVGPLFTCPTCVPLDYSGLVTATPRTVPACAAIMTFTPGRYTDRSALNNRTSTACNPGPNPIFHFLPGIYYFDFAPTTSTGTFTLPPPLSLSFTSTLTIPTKWTVSNGSLIAGALARPITAGSAPTMPDSCKSPVPTGAAGWVPYSGDGVQFVFSGNSQVEFSGNARAEICGEYAGTNAPIAIHALQTNILSSPALPASAAPCDFTGLLPCIAVQAGTTWGSASPPSALYIRGLINAPNRDVNLRVEADTRPQRYNGGISARRVVINTSRPTTAGTPAVFTVHAPITAAARRTVVNLDVRVCPGQATCTSGGTVGLRARVQITDPTGLAVAGNRQMSVIAWSVVQ